MKQSNPVLTINQQFPGTRQSSYPSNERSALLPTSTTGILPKQKGKMPNMVSCAVSKCLLPYHELHRLPTSWHTDSFCIGNKARTPVIFLEEYLMGATLSLLKQQHIILLFCKTSLFVSKLNRKKGSFKNDTSLEVGTTFRPELLCPSNT